jgi:hypothetical protein
VLAGVLVVAGSRSNELLHSASDEAALAVATRTPVTAAPSQDLAPATLNEVVQRYCVVCHNDQLMTGNVSFQALDVERAAENAPVAERMIRKLRAGMMPPPGMPRPAGDTLQVLVETLEARVDAGARSAPNLGERRFTRLTREEYERVVHDMLGLEVDASRWLPTDVKVGTFDNTAAAQALSTTLLDSFLRAAGEVSRMAVGDPSAVSISAKYKNRVEVSQHPWDHIEGTPFGTRGGMVVEHVFPADGKYVFQIETALGGGNQTSMEDVVVAIDGEQVALVMMENNAGNAIPAVRTEPIEVTAGQHQVAAAFVNLIEGPYEDRFEPTAWSWAGTQGNDYGITGLTHLTELIITGPEAVEGISESPSRQRIFSCHPTTGAQERPCAEAITRELASKAYRRAATNDDVADLMTLYDATAPDEGFEIGVRTVLQGILASPEFVFRFERQPENVQPGQAYRLSDEDLATRLAFFLWASTPDEELTRLARAGRLSNADVLEQQVDRMLADPRSEAMGTRFLNQWLRLNDVGKVWPEASMFPDFSTQLADAMVRESEMLFLHLIEEDKSVLELFSANYTFLNERLAQHYEIEGVAGEEMRLVQYPNDNRRGIFGHGSIAQLTSMSDRTSPVQRGKWVMEVLMGTPPPPPPPNVPAFVASPAAANGRRLTTRERMEAHRQSQVCNSCHRFIDPIGLALDNFDAVGKWRIRENMAPLDTRGMFYDGTAISTPGQLSDVLLKRPVPLVRNFTNRLLAYAIGRPTEYYDQPAVRAITQATAANGYKVNDLIVEVVKSDLFQMRQAQTTAN